MEAISRWLVTLPHDLKILYEAAADPNLDRRARELAVGAIIYTISPNHVPGVPRTDFVNYCDGAILIHLALQRVGTIGGEDVGAFTERFPEFYDGLDDELGLCESTLGDRFRWIQAKVDHLGAQTYKGKKVSEYLDDEEAGEFLYEEGLEFGTEYDVDEDLLGDRLKKPSTILDALDRRRKAEDRMGS
jgi:hypothetical protein